MLSILVAAVLSVVGDGVLRAEKDVPIPERVHYVAPDYPAVAREALVMGIVVLDVGLNEEGRPIDIKVLRGTPLIDRAALDAIKQWRYKPTFVDGSPRPVVLVEVVDVFPDEDSRIGYYARMLNDRKEAPAYRLLAIERLKAVGARDKAAVKALQKVTADPDQQIRRAATAALAELSVSVK